MGVVAVAVEAITKVGADAGVDVMEGTGPGRDCCPPKSGEGALNDGGAGEAGLEEVGVSENAAWREIDPALEVGGEFYVIHFSVHPRRMRL